MPITIDEASQNNPLSPDDLARSLILAGADDNNRSHIGLVGDTYTILLSGKGTAGRFCLIDMHIPPGGGPLHIATTSKRPSPSSTARWKPPVAERNPPSRSASVIGLTDLVYQLDC
ncbi:hypothetical protein [Tunturiibacter gelidoferens]|uniref:Uncharacterized protein n=1 Tax=Tunturiibacter gelidiferens TaxID=3069689 RepID=A0ACC5P3P3_9BACT|nr:hypothetical protein [Edaphobacter lichenicola]MBB5341474.1 hypothetical protein [Edaphobacter lichenicola]